ncbi:hypothetical protein TM074_03145 [Candidatus Nanosynbacter sp. TM7-074]|uniref:Uncharacterized protein n=1 Tax=Candidatus Nanosynbacter sp. TM7-074 TaxID=3158573 RepID=A0AB39JAF6_9BACT
MVIFYSANGLDRPAGKVSGSLPEVEVRKSFIIFMVFLSNVADEAGTGSLDIERRLLKRNIAIDSPPMTAML